jgi:hypothetical protein
LAPDHGLLDQNKWRVTLSVFHLNRASIQRTRRRRWNLSPRQTQSIPAAASLPAEGP